MLRAPSTWLILTLAGHGFVLAFDGHFGRRQATGGARVEIYAGELAMLLEGIDAPKVRRRKRYVLRPQPERMVAHPIGRASKWSVDVSPKRHEEQDGTRGPTVSSDATSSVAS